MVRGRRLHLDADGPLPARTPNGFRFCDVSIVDHLGILLSNIPTAAVAMASIDDLPDLFGC
jgi:hypothetical protein